LQEIRLGSARCNVESRATLSQIKLAVWSPERAQCPLQYRYRRQAVGSPIAPLKACVHYDAKARSCAKCGVRLISVCAVLSPAELQDMAAMSQSDRFAARKVVVSQGSPAENVFTITEGVVRLYKLLVDGRRQLLGFALPGDFLGLSLFDIYSFSADAVTDTVVCRFPRKAFIAYAEQRPHLLRRLHEFASHELSLAQDQMVLLGRRSAEERVAAFLVMMRDRLQRLGHTSPTLPLPMSRQDIADYLGLTIETVSRTFSKLAAGKSIVIVPDGVRLLRQRELEQLATG
jgi:CRP/FNR family transcriptional regulator